MMLELGGVLFVIHNWLQLTNVVYYILTIVTYNKMSIYYIKS